MSEQKRDSGDWTYGDALLAYKAYVDATMARMRADLTLAISRLRRAIAPSVEILRRLLPLIEPQCPPVKHRHGPRSWRKRARR